MKLTLVALAFFGLGATALTPSISVAGTTQCRDAGDPFAEYYGATADKRAWYITSVTSDHEDHGIHLVEGDSFTLDVTSDCEVVMAPGPNLSQRWGGQRRQMTRQSRFRSGGRKATHSLCTTLGLSHDAPGMPDTIARPHLVRISMIKVNGNRVMEIKYGHRSRMKDDCSNDGVLDNIHGGTAHAQD